MKEENEIVVHPLVLLSILDHFQRVDNKRVAGIILGTKNNEVHITNSFAVPFEENDEDGVWFFDTSYQQSMFDLFKKIQSSEKILGWYHSGLELQKNDIAITTSLMGIVSDPILLTVDVFAESNEYPVQVYQVRDNEFINLKTCIEAEEAEEVGVEHLIRDVKNNCGDRNTVLKNSLIMYEQCLNEIVNYLEFVSESKIRKNYNLLAFLQECLNEIPVVPEEYEESTIECYSAELTRSVVLINDLENNKKMNRVGCE